jgi:DNA-binding transcriptional MerR regulator
MKFELLGKLRDGDEEEAATTTGSSSGELPIDEVTRLSEQGYSETEIIEQLRDRGYAYGDINEALNAAVKESASQSSGGDMDQGFGDDQAGGGMDSGNDWEPQQSQTFDDQAGQPAQQQSQQPQQPMQQQPPPQQAPPEPQYEDEGEWGGTGVSPEEEEMIEIIVSEHMTDIEEQVNQFRTELEALREDFQKLQQQFNEIDIRKDEDEKVVIQKVNEMEDYFEQTSSRMGGMEKALQQVLPSLVENVRDLSTVVREMKEEQKR